MAAREAACRGRVSPSALTRAVLLVATLGSACAASEPRALLQGVDECAHCHMLYADPRYAAALVTTGGRTIPFDDLGCLAAFLETGGIPVQQVASLWAADFEHPEGLIRLDEAVLVQHDTLRTPMGYGVIALRPESNGLSGGRILDWSEVRQLAARQTP